MSATEFTVDSALPQIAAVTSVEGLTVAVSWADGRAETVDLAPALLRFKVYAPLRTDAGLLASVHVADEGFAIAWGAGDIDMASTTVEELAGQAMSTDSFAGFTKRHGYTLDAVAAELGISRRLAAYYQSGRPIPRHISLACAYLDLRERKRETA
ncbi:DUF2442 domain-containing protein [Lichenihabitans sp. Uapishka_5]|uniref:DUF2442 domain-containing protein n=1 Tax=Lichenihabitans sp. Uapishka_5 TaxID=3037302 RepID=UPI0029E7DDC8|nr:DUF2442 domain-containing protein [Lichenihabitans sp. Uapishka_5]MDX7952715.1 DUF2442 domain-containing protein [Lichenihabitans sp. Uapishka_5]